jgi:hypothetical protein
MKVVSRKEVRENFVYDGRHLRHKRTRQGVWEHQVGKIAGHVDKLGYRIVKFRQRAYKEHRLIWLLVYGYWPIEIDHINRNKSDNRLENLREGTHTDNMRNRDPRGWSSSGHVGVTKSRNKYKARLGQRHLGHFDKIEDAIAARKQAESQYWA